MARLSSRRGSVSAADPFAKHAELNLNPNRTSSSTLTIVRVPSTPTLPALQDPPNSRRLRRNNNTPEPPSPRLSFATSSFSNNPNTSPTSSPRLRPSSPTHHRSGSYSKPKLSAEQLYDLAKQSTTPRRSPLITTAATFTVLPDDIYLPFIDRPSEVAALIATPPSAKLFALLQQTFKKTTSGQDPTQWSYVQLVDWLTATEREAAPDSVWVLNARKCILFHSELIWERIKGALGVPPELDVDDLVQDYFSPVPTEDDEETKSDDLEDAGRKARGHWDDWDAVIDSPISERNPSSFPTYPISIEPLIAPTVTSSASSNPPPGLGDIAEGAEEEEDQETAKNTPEQDDKKEYIDPSQIHGIKISTSPVASRPASAASVSRSASFSSNDERYRRPSFSRRLSASGYESDNSDAGYNPVGDRAPGNPLFPSNFARLALGPTLAAK